MKLPIQVFKPLTHVIINYNRDIYNRNDDSVVSIMADRERILRRSRGYVPAPVRISYDVDGILAPELNYPIASASEKRQGIFKPAYWGPEKS